MFLLVPAYPGCPGSKAVKRSLLLLLLLCVHLSLLYTLCIRHGYLPARLMDINIIPLVKNKCGDITDMNNYRAIALCNVESKILEKIILSKVVIQ